MKADSFFLPTILFSAAILAIGPAPEPLVERLDPGHERPVLRLEADLEVPLLLALGPEPGAGQVGAPDVEGLVVNQYRLEMGPRAVHHLYPLLQLRVLRQLLHEGPRRLGGVDDPDLDPLVEELVEEDHDRLVTAAPPEGDPDRLQVGRRDPEGALRFDHPFEDRLLVELPVRQKLGLELQCAASDSDAINSYSFIGRIRALDLSSSTLINAPSRSCSLNCSRTDTTRSRICRGLTS